MADRDELLETARLARIAGAPEELQALADDCARIVVAFEALAQVDVEGVAPLLRPGAALDVAREDALRPGLDRADLLAGAPRTQGGYFLVPRADAAERASTEPPA